MPSVRDRRALTLRSQSGSRSRFQPMGNENAKPTINKTRRSRVRPSPGSLTRVASTSKPNAAVGGAPQSIAFPDAPAMNSLPYPIFAPAPAPQPAGPPPAYQPAAAAPPMPLGPTQTYHLPRHLPRPRMLFITSEHLAAQHPGQGLEGIPIPYLRARLLETRHELRAGLYATVSDRIPSGPSLPKSLSFTVRKGGLPLPTHVFLAFDLSRTGPPSSQRGFLFPFHDLVFTTQCTSLPAMPPPAKTETHLKVRGNNSTGIDLPCVPINLPRPDLFDCLFDFLYSHDAARVMRFLCPIPEKAIPAPPAYEDGMEAQYNRQLADILTELFSLPALIEQARTIHGMWRNVCTLGVNNDELWGAMNTAWKICLRALMKSVRVSGIPQPADQPEDIYDSELEEDPNAASSDSDNDNNNDSDSDDSDATIAPSAP